MCNIFCHNLHKISFRRNGKLVRTKSVLWCSHCRIPRYVAALSWFPHLHTVLLVTTGFQFLHATTYRVETKILFKKQTSCIRPFDIVPFSELYFFVTVLSSCESFWQPQQFLHFLKIQFHHQLALLKNFTVCFKGAQVWDFDVLDFNDFFIMKSL